MPQGKHSTLQGGFTAIINQHGKPSHSAYAFPELRCTFGGRSIVPNISVFAWNRIPLDSRGDIVNKITIPPDWAIEIVSPDQIYSLLIDKLVFCLRQGSRLGWLVDPEERVILTFEGNQLPDTKREEDILPVLSELVPWQPTAASVFNLLSFA